MVDEAAAQTDELADEIAMIATANEEQSTLVEDIDASIRELQSMMAAIDVE